jgi:hypothetical protein
VREARRFVVAVSLSVASIPIIADPAVGWIGFLPALVCISLGVFVFLVLRSSGIWVATGAAVGLTVMALTLLDHRQDSQLAGSKASPGAVPDLPRSVSEQVLGLFARDATCASNCGPPRW